jgi:hypothetical protein
MVEVFKTNVRDRSLANVVVNAIHKKFIHCKANFDLEDRDRILRIESFNGLVQTDLILEILMSWNIEAEVLPDEVPSFGFLSIPIENLTNEYK